MSDSPASSSPGSWPARIWGLALLGGAIGIAVHLIVPERAYRVDETYVIESAVPTASQLALATFLCVAGLALAYVLERQRHALSLGFALLAGAVTAQVVGQAGSGGLESTETWRLVCACLAVAIAAPLFQAWRERPAGRRLPEYAAAHDHAWTNLVLWFASFAFLGIVWALAFLLGALFDLIGIDLLQKLLERRDVGFVLTGLGLGAGIGLLRDRSGLLGSLRRVIATVLAVLAPVLAAGLLLFVLALPFTGLAPLWAATKSTTPILLSVMAGALILLNAVIGDSDADASTSSLLRRAAMVLAAVLLPLAGIAALSVGIRIDEHGLTPDRLWAITFVIIAAAYAVAATAALLRALPRFIGWQDRLRGGNLVLALLLCSGAVLLSTPLIDFGAISARNQLARLARGEVAATDFDWKALRFDFGPAGVAALKAHIAAGKASPEAVAALATTDRWTLQRRQQASQRRARGEERWLAIPRGSKIAPSLRDAISQTDACLPYPVCIVMFETPDRARVQNLDAATGDQGYGEQSFLRRGEKWVVPEAAHVNEAEAKAEAQRRRAERERALIAGDVTIRIVQRRQMYVGEQPVGPQFE